MIALTARRHGWQRPLHPLQIVGMAIYSFLVVAFYSFLGLFLGNRAAEITVTTLFTTAVSKEEAVAVMFLFIRCTAIDPSDRTSEKKKKSQRGGGGARSLRMGMILREMVKRVFRRMEKKILRTFIRRKYYLDPLKVAANQMEPLLPFPLVMKEDDSAVSPDSKPEDISFCSLCDFEVKKHSKHCRTCNRCVEGFDHHCRWLNNCVGKRNYTTFFLLMTFIMLMLTIEGGTAIAIFIRCFADKKGIEMELETRLHFEFPRPLLATITVLLVLMTVYSCAAMGQLFFFHVVLIRKGMRTYDYILAMRGVTESLDLEEEDEDDDPFDDSDFSSDSDDDSPKKMYNCKSICGQHHQLQNSRRLSIRIDTVPDPTSNLNTKKQGFNVSINPWKLLKMSREKAVLAAEKAKERLRNQKPEEQEQEDSLRPLPLETKCGPSMNINAIATSSSPAKFSSPRRRFSSGSSPAGIVPSPRQKKYRSSFDLKLTDVSKELETYISKQVLCSVIKKDASEASPRS
ncbi:Protein S-acyltransferase 18 [Linum grandiflorum]